MMIIWSKRCQIWMHCNDVGRWPAWQGQTRELRRSLAPFQQQS